MSEAAALAERCFRRSAISPHQRGIGVDEVAVSAELLASPPIFLVQVESALAVNTMTRLRDEEANC
jgi:hypothetical protein